MAEQRVQKCWPIRGICSRREAERLIAAGKVKVNGHPVGLGDKMDPITIRSLSTARPSASCASASIPISCCTNPRLLTTRSDDRGRKTVMDLVSDVPAMLRPVGRLDKDSEGPAADDR